MKDFWFIFSGQARHPLTRWLRKDFKHVSVLTDLAGICFMLDPLHRGVNIGFNADVSVPDAVAQFKAQGFRIVQLSIAKPESQRQLPVLTCASYLAYTCGIRFWGFTPYQLYKELIKQGGAEV